MFTIDLTLQYTPIPVSVQRKEQSDAAALYQEIVAAMKQDTPQVLELTCEKQSDKKVALLSDRIIAVMMSDKSGALASGRATGFFVNAE
ncbi:MAG: hypothetical protein SAJ12_05495 [Jaaginema sp. PMC 1079.18]|nr:hypothetical protein [Jaaginema sp. PMC 1080.18]MEC4850446.1 hypothetical protein [Jaaginema sp. PMC 1079.18]MEC4867510.1 hypothetical protein [Jaaginema sp. PMC 1078.18]